MQTEYLYTSDKHRANGKNSFRSGETSSSIGPTQYEQSDKSFINRSESITDKTVTHTKNTEDWR